MDDAAHQKEREKVSSIYERVQAKLGEFVVGNQASSS
jgi:hypothetical protein